MQKFLPMSITSWAENPADIVKGLVGAVVPTAKGTSQYAATQKATELLDVIANRELWSRIRMVPKYKQNIDAVLGDILDDAHKNGYDADKILTSAKGVVLGRLYKEFWYALNDNDIRKLNELGEAILRVGGTIKGVKASLSNRYSQYKAPKPDPVELDKLLKQVLE